MSTFVLIVRDLIVIILMNRMMKKQTQAIHTQFQRRDAYNSLSMPVYHTAAYEFDNADDMADAFCGRTDAPDYSRVMNPTVTFFENKVKELTGAAEVIALNSGMAAISNTLFSIAAAGKNIVTSRHLFGNTYSFIAGTLSRFGVEPRLCDLTDIGAVEKAVVIPAAFMWRLSPIRRWKWRIYRRSHG